MVAHLWGHSPVIENKWTKELCQGKKIRESLNAKDKMCCSVLTIERVHSV